MLLFAVAPFAGPALGPVVSGWLSVGGVSWRWTFWILTIFVSLSSHSNTNVTYKALFTRRVFA